MSKPTKTLARDVFLYLLATVTLYAIAVSGISLLFQYVNHFFPDAAIYTNVTEVLQVVVSILIIFTPVYVWVTRFLNRDLLANKEKHNLGIRRWLMHLTLFGAGITIMITLVTLIYNFLGGELTARFGLKVLSVLVVAAAIFAYYVWDLKREAQKMPAKMVWLARVTLAVLAIAVVGSFFIIESPSDQRMRKLDDERVEHLWELQDAVEGYWWTNEALPELLDDIDRELPLDPETNATYRYEKLSDEEYEICATFSFENTVGYARPVYVDRSVSHRDFYSHGAGEDCFQRTVEFLK